MYKHISLSLLLLAPLIWSGCGSSSSSVSTDTNALQSNQSSSQSSSVVSNSGAKEYRGAFIDAAVAGLSYSCQPSKMEGLTDKDGYFTCQQGDSISFYIAQNFIGSSSLKDIITPYDLLGGDAAINLAQLLQTLDSDGNVANGILIDNEKATKLLGESIDFNATDFDTAMQDSLGESLVGELEAKNHMDESIAALKPKPTLSSSSSTSSQPQKPQPQGSYSSSNGDTSSTSTTTTTTPPSKPSTPSTASSSSLSYCQQYPTADICNIAQAGSSSSSTNASSSSGGIDYGSIGDNITQANQSSSTSTTSSSSSSTSTSGLNVSICDLNPTAPECLSLSTDPLIALAPSKRDKIVPKYYALSGFVIAENGENLGEDTSKMLALCQERFGTYATLAPKEVLAQMIELGYDFFNLKESLKSYGMTRVVDTKGNSYSLEVNVYGHITIKEEDVRDTSSIICYAKEY